MYETLEVSTKASIVTVSLNRPGVRNAFNSVMIDEVTHVFRSQASRDDVRLIILKGEGTSFSAGADAAWMAAGLNYSHQENVQDARRMAAMYEAINTVPQPVISRVHGACLGGGMGLIAVSDIVVAATNTVFGFTEARLGIIPAVISRYVLPKIGESWARALFTSAERFGADLAREIGLVHWVCLPTELDDTMGVKVDHVLHGGPMAVRAAKSLVAEMAHCSPSEIEELTIERISELRTSSEGQAGLRAFLHKQRPSWNQD